MVKGNKGEWSEVYTLFKLLSDKQLVLGDRDLQRIDSAVYPIIKVLRTEVGGEVEYSIAGDAVVVTFSDQTLSIDRSRFRDNANLLLDLIKGSTEKTFELPDIQRFMDVIACSTLKASSSAKTDIRIIIHDQRTSQTPTLGFSIKSQVGSASTLLNASRSTNFVYQIDGVRLTQSQIDEINALGGRSKVQDRLSQIMTLGGRLSFVSTQSTVFGNNLVLIDSRLPELLSEVILCFYTSRNSKIIDLIDVIQQKNPLRYDLQNNHHFYVYKVKKLLVDIALGMMPSRVWGGDLDATGGYIIVREDGDLVCYHIYDRNQFEDYLIHNTKLETPSVTRHGFAEVYTEGDKQLIKLNLQIRFLK